MRLFVLVAIKDWQRFRCRIDFVIDDAEIAEIILSKVDADGILSKILTPSLDFDEPTLHRFNAMQFSVVFNQFVRSFVPYFFDHISFFFTFLLALLFFFIPFFYLALFLSLSLVNTRHFQLD